MNRRFTEMGAAALAFTTVFALTGIARAQDTATAGGSAQVGGGTSAGMTLPGAAPTRHAAAVGDSDHDGVIGDWGVGLLGVQSLGVPCIGGVDCNGGNGAANAPGTTTVNAPVVGVRYWLTDMIGIDAGLGLGIHSLGGSASPGGDIKRPSSNAFIIHGGVPLALASSGHFTFEVIPEMNLGFANWSLDGTGGAQDTSGSTVHFDVGARIGAEIHFGFIGIPKLALQGTVGLQLGFESSKLEASGGGAPTVSQTLSTFDFGTTVQGAPWAIFTNNISALYYF